MVPGQTNLPWNLQPRKVVFVTSPPTHLSGRALRTPGAAAVAGIIFAVLYTSGYFLIQLSLPEKTPVLSPRFLDQTRTLGLGLSLIPFAGIAFIWFIGVVRDRLGYLEDQFFSTLFLGSGLLYLGLTFASAAIASGLLVIYAADPDLLINSNAYLTARSIANRITVTYSIRMAGMFMMVLGTIWIRTGLMPRWLALLTFALAAVLLLSIGISHWVTLVFPAWVAIISAMFLFYSYRQRKKYRL